MTVPVLLSRDAAEETTLEPGRLSALMLKHGSMELRWYAPKLTDSQGPHDKDEVYVVIAGRGWFVCGEQRVVFRPGDALFVLEVNGGFADRHHLSAGDRVELTDVPPASE